MTPEELALFGITPESILKVYAFGFGAVLSSWLTGFVVSVSLALVRKV